MNLGGKVWSEPRLCHCTPAWATEQKSISKEGRRKKEKEKSEWGRGEGEEEAAQYNHVLNLPLIKSQACHIFPTSVFLLHIDIT